MFCLKKGSSRDAIAVSGDKYISIGEVESIEGVPKEYMDKIVKRSIDVSSEAMPYPPTAVGKNNRIFISGATGSGKTTWIGKFLPIVLSARPDLKRVYVFSDVEMEADNILTKPISVSRGQVPVLRVLLDDSILNPIQTSELADSICIFDDIDSISNRKIREAVRTLYEAILKKGSSKNNIYLMTTYHQMFDYRNTRDIILNSDMIVFFKGGMNTAQLTKLGIPKEYIPKILTLPSRYVCFHKNYPQYIIHAGGVFLL